MLKHLRYVYFDWKTRCVLWLSHKYLSSPASVSLFCLSCSVVCLTLLPLSHSLVCLALWYVSLCCICLGLAGCPSLSVCVCVCVHVSLSLCCVYEVLNVKVIVYCCCCCYFNWFEIAKKIKTTKTKQKQNKKTLIITSRDSSEIHQNITSAFVEDVHLLDLLYSVKCIHACNENWTVYTDMGVHISVNVCDICIVWTEYVTWAVCDLSSMRPEPLMCNCKVTVSLRC